MKTKDGFVIYTGFYAPIRSMTDEQLGRLFRALFEWQLQDGSNIDVDSDIQIPFGFFVNQFRVDRDKYNMRVQAQRQNGLKGGAPKGNQNARKNNPNQPKSTQTSYKDKEKDKDKDKDLLLANTITTHFVKPSLDDVVQYCMERGNNVDAAKFIDHYESNGWKIGKAPMKNWKAAIRTWERNQQDTSAPYREAANSGRILTKDELL